MTMPSYAMDLLEEEEEVAALEELPMDIKTRRWQPW
jgi:hypothetical protein